MVIALISFWSASLYCTALFSSAPLWTYLRMGSQSLSYSDVGIGLGKSRSVFEWASYEAISI